MTKKIQTVWQDKSGSDLLVQKDGDSGFFIPLGTVSKDVLGELVRAGAEALGWSVTADLKPETK